MRALVQPQFGDPSDVLSVQEVPDPQPGPGQALVRVLLSPIHNHDLWTVRGSYGFKPEMPARAGTEAVGVVEALGEGVEGLTVGQRVATGGSFGAWAELIVAPAAGLIPVPDVTTRPPPSSSRCRSARSRCSTSSRCPRATGSSRTPPTVRSDAPSPSWRGARRPRARTRPPRRRRRRAARAGHRAGRRDRRRRLARPRPRDRGRRPDRRGGRLGGRDAAGDVVSLLADDGVLVVFGAMASPTMEIGSGDVIFKQVVIKGFWGSKVFAAMSRGSAPR